MISRKRKTERRVSRGLFRLAAYGLFGVIFALSVTAMLLSGHINFQRFYDVGEICDVREVGGAGVAGLSYSGETNSYQVLDDVASKAYYIQSRENCWNYFYIKIDVLNAPELNVTFLGCDAAGAERFRADYALKDGDNYLAIGGQAFEQCRLAIERQKGTEFRIYKLRFFEKEIAVWGKKAWLIAAAVWVCFMAVGLLLSRKRRVPFVGALDAFIDLWQEIFCICGRGAIDIGKKCSEKGRRLIRVTLFLLFIWGSYYFFITDIYKQNKNLVYLFGGAVSVALAVFCFDKRPKKLPWHSRLVYLWVMVWGISIVSDVIVGKKNGEYLGIAMLLPVSFLFFAWHNMDRPKRLLEDFMDAIEISAWIRILHGFVFLPYGIDPRYGGIDQNPGILAMFLILSIVMFIAKVDQHTHLRRPRLKCLRYLIGIGITLQLIWHTQSIIGIGALAALGILYFGRFVLRQKMAPGKKKHFVVLGYAIVIGLSFVGANRIMSRNSDLQEEAAVVAERQMAPLQELIQEWHLFSEPVYAKSKIGESRVYEKLFRSTSMESLTSARNLYWAEYLRSMNLFGNKKEPFFWQSKHLGHNAPLSMGNWYGVLVIAPYLLLFAVALRCAYSKIHLHGDNSAAIFALGCIFGGICVSMGDNVEQPFLIHLWIALYLCIGFQFPSMRENPKNHRNIGASDLEE